MILSKTDFQRLKEIKATAAELQHFQNTEEIVKAVNKILDAVTGVAE